MEDGATVGSGVGVGAGVGVGVGVGVEEGEGEAEFLTGSAGLEVEGPEDTLPEVLSVDPAGDVFSSAEDEPQAVSKLNSMTADNSAAKTRYFISLPPFQAELLPGSKF